MKKTFLIGIAVVALLILPGCGDPEALYNPLTAADCPPAPEGLTPVQYARVVGAVEEGTSTPSQVFADHEWYGLRCYYEEVVEEAFDFEHEYGRSLGAWRNLYEMELRISDSVEAGLVFDEDTFPDLLDGYYCKEDIPDAVTTQITEHTTAQKMWDLSDEYSSVYMDRYQCAWPTHKLASGGETTNTSSLLNKTIYHNAVITYRVVRETTLSQFLPTDLSLTGEPAIEQGFQARKLIYSETDFLELPVEREDLFITELVQIADTANQRMYTTQ